ncbi:hypothetical protein PLESTB_001133900 [Pleodorina starrii]|uniref:Queuine tRNA-ribosyltransferase accessory subunit 2 n=1 Tax=Pleodorina starrii TaxID=330485 RepID=A0A9W6BR29_9CHLO|nr:hypothetical protein PLESTB_001133900 [Pleodorina starrii]
MIAALAAQSMATTATHFSVRARDGKARCGILTTKNGSIETPAVLLYTRRGGPLSLTSPDMLAAVTPPVQGVQLDAMQFLENPDASIIREHGGGAHGFLCLEGFPIVASNRDPTMYEYGTRPSTDKEVHVSIHSGGHMVSPERYMETIAALKPDLFVSLCDEVTADTKPKRVATATKRTTAWLDACLQLHAAYQQRQQQQQQEQQRQADPPAGQGANGAAEAQPSSSGNDGVSGSGSGAAAAETGPLSDSLLLAALSGGGQAAERARAAAAVAEKEGVGGYALCGLGTGEPPERRPALIGASLGALPAACLERRPVFAPGLAVSPEELLAAVAEGVDLLDCALVAQDWRPEAAVTGAQPAAVDASPATSQAQAQGGAAAGATGESAPDAAPALAPAPAPGLGPDVSIGADDTKINLWSTSYRLDKGPLLPGCGCFTCRRHSRAYVHHLLNTHEMLADVLLEAHNTSHVMAFCQAIREAISEGRFELYQQWFSSLRAAPLVPAPRHVTSKRRASGPPEAKEAAVAAGASGEAGAEEAAGAAEGPEAAGEPRRSKWVRV